jgi:hypothetical protein
MVKVTVPVFHGYSPEGMFCKKRHPLVTPDFRYTDENNRNDFWCEHGHLGKGHPIYAMEAYDLRPGRDVPRPRTFRHRNPQPCSNCRTSHARCEAKFAKGEGPCCIACVYNACHDYAQPLKAR